MSRFDWLNLNNMTRQGLETESSNEGGLPGHDPRAKSVDKHDLQAKRICIKDTKDRDLELMPKPVQKLPETSDFRQ